MDLSPVQKQRRKFHLFSWSGAILLIGILAALNFIVSYLPLRLDTSDGSVYSLSKGSKDLVKKLDDTLLIQVVFTSQLPPEYKLNEKYLGDLLSEYKRASGGKIRIEYFDPSKSTKARQQAMEMGIVPVQVDVRERDRREVKECFMGAAFLYGDKKEAIPLVKDTQGLEYEITLRIKKILSPEKPMIAFIQNGGTLGMRTETFQMLTKFLDELYQVQEIDVSKPIPTGVKALWWIGPTQPAEETALDNIKKFLQQGGSVGLLIDNYNVAASRFTSTSVKHGLEPFLAQFGIKMDKGLVVDPRCDRIQIRASQGVFQMINVIDYQYFPLVGDLDRSHPATRDVEGISMPFVSPVEKGAPVPGLKVQLLARSSDQSYLDNAPVYLNPLDQPVKREGAADGPFGLAAVVEGRFGTAEEAPKPGRLIVFGTSQFIRSEFPVRPSNYNLFVNMIDWTVQDEVLLQIRSKGYARRPLKLLSDGAKLFVKYSFMFALPILTLAMAFFVWRHQKKRRALMPLIYKEA